MGLSFIMVLAASVIKGITLLVSYIANNTFPLPLSEKDEQIYLQRLKSGDEDARNVLIERNLRLVAHIVKKFDNTGEDVDDLISIGTIGLIKAINTFDPAKKIRLATYAARCIENEILMHLRSTRRIRTEVSLYDPIGVDKEGNEFTLHGYLLIAFKPRITWAIRGIEST
jgi:RNA polymerase sporulation-specific sigma factor